MKLSPYGGIKAVRDPRDFRALDDFKSYDPEKEEKIKRATQFGLLACYVVY